MHDDKANSPDTKTIGDYSNSFLTKCFLEKIKCVDLFFILVCCI